MAYGSSSFSDSLIISPRSRPRKDLTTGSSRGSKMLALSISQSNGTSNSNSSSGSPSSFYSKSRLSLYKSSNDSSQPVSQSTKRPFINDDDDWVSDRLAFSSPSPPSKNYIPRSLIKRSPGLLPPPQKRSKVDSPEGFINLGNTCYLNAVLQSLLGLRCFALDIVQSNLGPSVDSQSLFRMVYLLVKSKYNGDCLSSQIILIKKIRSVICSRAKEFYGFNEQDAHELLTHCLSNLRTDISALIDQKISDTCPVEINFKSCIEQSLTCHKCQSTLIKHEETLDFSLNFITPERNSLQELLEDYFQSEDVDYKCSSCGHGSCKLSRKISSLPRVLILTLKRYSLNDYGSCDKRIEPVRISRLLNLSPVSKPDVILPAPYDNHKDILGPLMGKVVEKKIDSLFSPQGKTSPTKISYKLTSVISHVGASSSSGHYVSEVHCPLTNNWWHCNDSKVKLTTEEHVRQSHQRKAYILFYIHHH